MQRKWVNIKTKTACRKDDMIGASPCDTIISKDLRLMQNKDRKSQKLSLDYLLLAHRETNLF